MTNSREVIASPSTRAHAARNGLAVEEVARARGRTEIAREDVDAHLQGGGGGQAEAPRRAGGDPWETDHAAWGPVHEEKLSRFARLSAANLGEAARRIPQVTHHDRADVSQIEAFRARMKPEAETRGIRLTALALHALALTRTLRAFPRVNASLSADGERLILKDYVHIGIAVDTEHGLMVPVLRDVDGMGLWQIAEAIADLAARARARKLPPADMGGASMTITNLGPYGGIGFTPIVNPPEVAILGLSRATIEPVWDGAAFQPRPLLPLDLSYDHRVVNGAEAAKFVSHFKALIEEPRRLLI